MQRRRAVVVALMGFGIGGLLSGLFLIDDGVWGLSWAGYVIVGGLICLKQPDNRIGQLLLVIGLSWSFNFVAFPILERWSNPTAIWLEIAASITGYVAWLAVIMIPVTFPSGRVVTRAGRLVKVTVIALLGMLVIAELASTAPKEPGGVVSPLAAPDLAGLVDFLLNQGFVGVPILLLVALVDMLVRWRRATGVERLQFNWLLAALGIVIPLLVLIEGLSDLAGFEVLATLSLNLIPLAIAVAVLRYRLYEIDRLLSRTIGYAVVIATLALIYSFGAVWLPSRIVGGQSDLFVAGSTLLAASAFNPIRRRVLKGIDRRFYRSRFNAETVASRFSSELLNEVDVDQVTGRWLEVVSKTLQPSTAAVWLRPG